MKLSARNVIKAKVIKVVKGAVNAEVILELPGGEQITSIITIGSVNALELVEGKDAYAVIKATNVIIAVD